MSVLKYYDTVSQTYRSLPLGTESVAVYDNGYAYSTDEQIVGCWIDGRPIYRKTYSFITPSSNSWTTFQSLTDLVNVDISDYSNIKKMYGYVIGKEGSVKSYVELGTVYAEISFLLYPYSATRLIKGLCGSNCTSQPACVTFEYTKTTDAENSFTLDMLSVGDLDKTCTQEEIDAVLGN